MTKDSKNPSPPSNSKEEDVPTYEYLPPTLGLRAELDMMEGETAKEKFKRKFKEQPLIPIGCCFTAAALTYGMYQMKTGNRFMSQRMMRMRILAQGFTVIACLFGVLHASKTSHKPELTAKTATVPK